MKYDIVKDKFAKAISIFPFLRVLFYKSLNTLILRQKYVMSTINKLYPNSSASFKMYDAGGGYLQYSDFVLRNYSNSSVHAVDIKEDYIDDYSFYVKGKELDKRYTYHCADLQNYIPKEKFDLIIAIDIMEHIEDDIATLNNFKRCLVNGGKLIISTPSTFDEAAAFTEEHVRPGYDMDELVEKLLNAGFKIDRIKYTYGKYGAKYWKLCMKTPMQIFKKSKLGFVIVPIYLLLMFPLIQLYMYLDMKTENKQGNGILVVASNNDL